MSQTASLSTVARLGGTVFPVRLFKTVAEPDSPTFDKAGPHGGRIVDYVLKESVSGSPGAKAIIEKREEGHLEEALENSSLRIGVWIGEEFIDLSDHLDRIDEEEALEEMEILDFVRREALPLDRVLGCYWLAPGDPLSAKVLKLIHVVGRAKHRCAVVAWTKKTNRALGVAIPHASGAMLVVEISFAENRRDIPSAALMPSTVDVSDEEITAMTALVEAMSESPDALDEIEDDRRRRRRQLREYVEIHGEAPPIPDEMMVPEVIPEATEFIAVIS